MRPFVPTLAVAFLGCRAAAPVPEPLDVCSRPRGEPWMAALRPGASDLHGFTLEVTAVGEHAYALRVSGPGVRRAIGEGGPACGPRPDPDDPCAAIPFVEFHDDLWLRVQEEGLVATSIYVDGLHVQDFAEVDAAAVALADTLRAWRIEEPWFLRVVAPTCVELLGAR